MNFLKLLYICFLFGSCSSSTMPNIFQSQNLDLAGLGGRYLGEVKQVSLTYISNKQLNLNEARQLYVQTLENLLQRMNANPVYKSDILTYPLSIDNLDVMIGFDKSPGVPVDSDYIAMIYKVRGNIIYSIRERDNYKHVHEESYSEALRIVRCGK